MNFDILPKPIFLQIIQYLPFNQQIRIGRVSKSFRVISQLAISKIDSLFIDGSMLRRIRSPSVKAILDLSAPNLQEIKLGYWYHDYLEESLVSVFCDYPYPRLIDLQIWGWRTQNRLLVHFLTASPQLKNVTFEGVNPRFPNTVLEKLEFLELRNIDDETCRSLIGKTPNLKKMSAFWKRKPENQENVLDLFLRSVPYLEILETRMAWTTPLADFSHIWNLTSMTTLKMANTRADDSDLRKISASLPRLEKLELSFLVSVTPSGIAVLGELTQLQILKVFISEEIDITDDGSMRKLANCSRLHELYIPNCAIRALTFISLIRHCPHLHKLAIWDVPEMESKQAVVSVLESLRDIQKRRIKIAIDICADYAFGYANRRPIWFSRAAEAALADLAENGVCIEFYEHSIRSPTFNSD